MFSFLNMASDGIWDDDARFEYGTEGQHLSSMKTIIAKWLCDNQNGNFNGQYADQLMNHVISGVPSVQTNPCHVLCKQRRWSMLYKRLKNRFVSWHSRCWPPKQTDLGEMYFDTYNLSHSWCPLSHWAGAFMCIIVLLTATGSRNHHPRMCHRQVLCL